MKRGSFRRGAWKQKQVEKDVMSQSRRSHLVLDGVKSTYLGCSHFQIILSKETFVHNLEKIKYPPLYSCTRKVTVVKQ